MLVVVVGQLNYLPARFDFLRQLFTFAQTTNPLEVARWAYGAANYDLLAWVDQQTPPQTSLLLLTASPHTYGDSSYVLYHRAIYSLYPRTVWWAAPVPLTRYPAWWIFTNLHEDNILALAQKYHATTILADGFAQPPLSGSILPFDDDTQLIFLEAGGQKSEVRSQKSVVSSQRIGSGRWSAIGGLLRSLGALLSIWLWGDLFYKLTIGSRFARSWAQRLALGWLLGCGVTSLGTFILLWIGLSLSIGVTVLSLLGVALWLRIHYRPCHPITLSPCHLVSLSPITLSYCHLFFFILILQAGLVAFAAWVSPLADWDAWVNWASKANAIFMDQTLSPNLYHNPARLPTNIDYPLMLPLIETWFYTWLGYMYEPVINFISFMFYLALLLLFYHAARLLASPTAALGFTALLATIPRLERPAHGGLADIPLAALVLLSFLFLYEWNYYLTHQNLRPIFPSSNPPTLQPAISLLPLALSTGLLPWLKNEGWLWWGLVSMSLLVGLGLLARRNYLSSRQAATLFLFYFGLALTIPLLWQWFLNLHGTNRFTFLPLTLANFWANLPRLPLISWHMLTRLFHPYWNFIWLVAGLALLSRRQRVLSAPTGWLILPVLGYVGLISLSFIFSRFDPFLDHLNNSAERLILQAAPLVVWWLLGQSVALGWVKENPRNSGELRELEEISRL